MCYLLGTLSNADYNKLTPKAEEMQLGENRTTWYGGWTIFHPSEVSRVSWDHLKAVWSTVCGKILIIGTHRRQTFLYEVREILPILSPQDRRDHSPLSNRGPLTPSALRDYRCSSFDRHQLSLVSRLTYRIAHQDRKRNLFFYVPPFNL